ncbi:DNA repair protein [Wickerhamomyces ciferrii]|uniref:DNA repair protein n=1 Tax=Wickerhamomyces ciferrii (strain ATCC 14091 / BCRC 22168 / CBS 111 / JCM 3599 / NBRC 0793 / NRRL Y-1031 F-60-10) TaxID=1206466 RepID=K0KLN1_WICCF|nr:DNA repair protein [Wickerhamomyces ciferrii]CCH46170.1 DNA repair protein [Wickerhamomyces ciferrii]
MSRRPLKYRSTDAPPEGAEAEDQRGIRGPSSALTEFLRQQGINAEAIRQRHLRRLRGEEGDGEEEGQGDGGNQGENGGDNEDTNNDTQEGGDVAVSGNGEQDQEDEEKDEEELQMRIAARRKRRAAAGKDDDEYTDSDEDELGSDEESAEVRRRPRRRVVGEEETCAQCFNKFIVNVYTKSAATGGYLCPDCTTKQLENERAMKRNQMLSRKKRQRLAAALLDRQDLKIPTLQDLAIKKVTERIEDVEQFGDIGSLNMKKIAKILCRNRSLDDNTLQLFLDIKNEKLEFWDCSKLTKNSYEKITSYCPNVKDLKLLMCGRLHNDNLNYFTSNLHHLTKIELDGPFLINNDTWRNFFENVGDRLTGLKISNTHRFDDETFKTFLEKCGPNLTELKLSRLDGIKEKESYDLMPVYLTKLESLEISYPHEEEQVSDSALINLLSINGETLHTLVLDGSSGLTDEFLVNGIKPFCVNLRSLSLSFLDQITSEGFVALFNEWNSNLGLNEVYLRKCFSLGDEGIIEFLLHSGQSLVELSINSVKDLTVDTFQIMKCPNLTYLDTGFVRAVDDVVLELIGKNCPQLKVLDCYGNNRCTSKAKIREGLKVIGRQSDTI